MSQDKSREFLHSGNAKDKFKFFFKATLLHHVDDLLKSIEKQLNGAQELVGNLENSIRPILKEFSELQGKIKSMEQVEEISQRVQLLKKKLAWAHVYDIDDQIQQAEARIEKLKGHIPYCEDLIARQTASNKVKMEGLEDRLAKKKAQIAILMERTSEVRKMKEELPHNRSEATKERSELEQDCIRRVNEIKRIMKRAEMLEQQIRDTSDQDDKHTQAEEHEMEENLSELKKEVEEAVLQFERYKKDEDSLSNSIQFQKVQSEIEVLLKKDQQNRSSIRDLRLHQTNKVTAFGGNRVTNLLRAIERHHYRFGKPPIGPIGAHLFLDRLPSQKKIPMRQKSFGNHSTGSKLTLDDLLEKLRNSHASGSYALLESHSGYPQVQHMVSLTPAVSPASSNQFPLDILTKNMLKQCDSSTSGSYALMEIRISYPKEQHMIPPTPDVSHASSNRFPSDILTKIGFLQIFLQKKMLKQCDSSNEKLRNSHASGSYASGFYALLESHSGYSKVQHMVPPTPAVSPESSNLFPLNILTKNMLKQCDSSAGRQHDPNPKV
ncbi:hypothetical protein POM88_000077 [Heracleum sosnowskyi]|uniref:Uncharacterized protein n=1 Tax=Heracleum sosnowskyi TaxID=360622 RepID=A0AAD8N904_9APIA|nr:hypothetical protein POM88_000077 [Heracleum sosnowskyi]